MDRKTYEALQTIIELVEGFTADDNEELDLALERVSTWMEEVEKEIED